MVVGHGVFEDRQGVARYVEEVVVIWVFVEGLAPGDCEEGGLIVAED